MWCRCVGLLLTWGWPAFALAADLAVQPVRIELAPGHDRAAITVTNRSGEATVIQVDTLSWTQAGAQDRLVPTTELRVNPPMFTLPAGGSQVLRLGVRRAPGDLQRESTYRLLLREVPSAPALPGAGATPAQGVRVLLQISVPVYAAPSKIVPGQAWQARRAADGAIAVDLRNTGNAHILVTRIALRPEGVLQSVEPLAQSQAGAVVMAGQSRGWVLRPDAPVSGPRVVLNAETDQGRQHVVLDLGVP